MLTDTQKADIRRHLGFGPVGNFVDPVTGTAQGGSFISYRFFVTQGLLEFRMDHLSQPEEIMLVGSGNPLSPANPNIPLPDGVTFIDGYINICNYLQNQIWTASDNLDTSKAGDWTARKDEVQARRDLYIRACSEMAEFMYVPMGAKRANPGRLVA